jgi:hypothetical protein
MSGYFRTSKKKKKREDGTESNFITGKGKGKGKGKSKVVPVLN